MSLPMDIRPVTNTPTTHSSWPSCSSTLQDLAGLLDEDLPNLYPTSRLLPKTEEPEGWGCVPPKTPSTHPTTSYGLLIFHWDKENQEPIYFLTQRRDTIPYILFMRGVYKLEYIERYFSLMTPDERERLRKYPFSELWKDVCVKLEGKLYRQEMEQAEKHWESINNDGSLDKWLNNTTSIVPDQEWGFPKGRLFRRETPLSCAYREYMEETGLGTDDMIALERNTFVETFYGSDDKLYSTEFFPALMTKRHWPEYTDYPELIRPRMISDEMQRAGWFSYGDAIKLLDERKQRIIKEADEWIRLFISPHGFMSCPTVPLPRKKRKQFYSESSSRELRKFVCKSTGMMYRQRWINRRVSKEKDCRSKDGRGTPMRTNRSAEKFSSPRW